MDCRPTRRLCKSPVAALYERRILRSSIVFGGHRPPLQKETTGAGTLRTVYGNSRAAFTLVELLVVLAIIVVLVSLLLPVLSSSKGAAQRIQCANSLHQFGIAAQMYWDDNAGKCFPYRGATTNNGIVYWFGWLQNGVEGQRLFDATQGALYPYVLGRGIEVCPSLNYLSGQFKLKATGATYGYGYNLSLATANIAQLGAASDFALLSDAAQVNTFEAPASPAHPMLEEFYYVDAQEATAHFRHQARANVLFCDSHVGSEIPVTGSIDQRMPTANVGTLRAGIVTLP